jgi:hypothetical protein
LPAARCQSAALFAATALRASIDQSSLGYLAIWLFGYLAIWLFAFEDGVSVQNRGSQRGDAV